MVNINTMVNSNTKKNTKKNKTSKKTTSSPNVSRRRASSFLSPTKVTRRRASDFITRSPMKIMPKMKKLSCYKNLLSERSKLEMIMKLSIINARAWLKDCDPNNKLRPKYENLLRGIKPKSWSEGKYPKWSTRKNKRVKTRKTPWWQAARSSFFAES